jgi:hypothetical protein
MAASGRCPLPWLASSRWAKTPRCASSPTSAGCAARATYPSMRSRTRPASVGEERFAEGARTRPDQSRLTNVVRIIAPERLAWLQLGDGERRRLVDTRLTASSASRTAIPFRKSKRFARNSTGPSSKARSPLPQAQETEPQKAGAGGGQGAHPEDGPAQRNRGGALPSDLPKD